MELNAFWYVSRSTASHRQVSGNFYPPSFFYSWEILAGLKQKENDSEIGSLLVCTAITVASQCEIQYKNFIKEILYLQYTTILRALSFIPS